LKEVFFTMAKTYKFMTLDTRKDVNDQPYDFGIEITSPKFLRDGIVNLDHHGQDATSSTPSAIEQALTCELPADGAVLATIRPDADSVGAMAVLANRAAYVGIDARLVAAIGAVDRHGPQTVGFEDLHDLTVAIARISADNKLSLEERVRWVSAILCDGFYDRNQIKELVAARDKEYEEAAADSKVTVVAGGRVSVVESEHRFATSLGYEYAPIVIAYNPTYPVKFGDTSKGTYKKFTICRYNEFVPVDMKAILSDLNELETKRTDDGAKWGGQINIVGSPQGRDAELNLEEVVGIVCRHLK
jgi:hypothetical protein